MQPSEVCRICGGKGLFLQILDPERKYCDDLEDCLSLKVKPDDGRSQVICHKCLGTLNLCKSYLSKIEHVKKDNCTSSNRKCYTCQSSKGHLFPLPENSAKKLQEYFGLDVKPKNSKICHECQYYLDCVGDLRDKANTEKKLSPCGQDLKFVVLKKESSVDDLVGSLKNREVKVDSDILHSRKTSRMPKSSLSKLPKQGNGATTNNIEEEDRLKKKSGARNVKNVVEDDSSDRQVVGATKKPSRHSPKDCSLSDTENSPKSPKSQNIKRKRKLSRSSDSDSNISKESTADSRSKKLVRKEESHHKSKRSSHDYNNSKQSEPAKRPSKSKDSKETAKSKPSPKSKRLKRDKSEETGDSGSDSETLAGCAESLKMPGKNKNVFNSNTPQKKSLNSRNRPESSKSPRKVHFVPEITSKKGKLSEDSRKKRVNAREDSSAEGSHVVKTKKRRNLALKAYTCTICSNDFRSTVEGKEHELNHDKRFNNFEIKVVRMQSSEITFASEKCSSKRGSENYDEDNDDDDDLWTVTNTTKVSKAKKALNEATFDSLFSAGDKPMSSDSVSGDLLTKTDSKVFNNSSDSEEEEASGKDKTEVDKPEENSEEKPEEAEKPDEVSESKSSEIAKPNEVPEPQPSEVEKPVEKKMDSEKESDTDTLVPQSINGKTEEAENKTGGESHEKDSKLEKDESPALSEEERKSVEPVPEENKSEVNGTDDADAVMSSEDKKETNSDAEGTTEDDSSAIAKKSDSVEITQSDPDSSVKEAEVSDSLTAAEETVKSDSIEIEKMCD